MSPNRICLGYQQLPSGTNKIRQWGSLAVACCLCTTSLAFAKEISISTQELIVQTRSQGSSENATPRTAKSVAGAPDAQSQSSNSYRGEVLDMKGGQNIVSERCEALFSRPKSLGELLENLKRFVDGGHLLHQQFFTKRCISKVIGAEDRETMAGSNGDRDLWVIGKAFVVDSLSRIPVEDIPPGMQFSASCRWSDSETTDGVISLVFVNGKGPRFNDIATVFGNEWILEKAPPPDGPPPPVTGDHGNEVWRREIRTINGSVRKMEIDFGSDGTLSIVNIVERK